MNCDVIKDLIPLVKEDLASAESDRLVKEHIKTCDECRTFYDDLDNNLVPSEVKEHTPLNFIAKSINKDRMLYGFMIGSLLLSIFLVLASFLTYPHPVEYKDGLITKNLEGDIITLNFSDEVTRTYLDWGTYDGADIAYVDGSYTYLDRILGGRSVGIVLNKSKVDSILYNNNNDTAAKVIYDPKSHFLNAGGTSLPRLVLSMYLRLAMGIFIIFLILVLTIFRKKSKYTKIRILYVPISYIIATFLIKGSDLTSHHLVRDLVYILLTSLAIYLLVISLSLHFERKNRLTTNLGNSLI